ncbi:hypothetical protein PG987_004402 [Apiospora arundinis]
MTHRPDPAIARSVALPLKLQNPESTRPSQIRTMLLIIQITCVVRLFVVPATDEQTCHGEIVGDASSTDGDRRAKPTE